MALVYQHDSFFDNCWVAKNHLKETPPQIHGAVAGRRPGLYPLHSILCSVWDETPLHRMPILMTASSTGL